MCYLKQRSDRSFMVLHKYLSSAGGARSVSDWLISSVQRAHFCVLLAINRTRTIFFITHSNCTIGLYKLRIHRIICDGYSNFLIRLRLKTPRKLTRDLGEIGGSRAVLFALSKGPYYRQNHHTSHTPSCMQVAFPHRFQKTVIGL